MILKNLSHETHVEIDGEYDNLPGYKYNDITYTSSSGNNITCRFAEKKDKSKGIIPRILMELLSARKKYKKLMAIENRNGNKFKASILDGLQLAYKVTANSLYGQTGASTSQIYKKEIAASTTATGRDMLQYAKKFIEEIFGTILKLSLKKQKEELKKYLKEQFIHIEDEKFNLPDKGFSNRKEFYKWCYSRSRELLKGYKVNPKIIYGDTDSVFFDLNIIDKKTNEKMTNQTALEMSIKLGLFSSDIVNILMPHPMNLEYEKVLWPFIILTKKRYVGNLYEEDPQKYYQKSMGIVLKRRDNAPIVKVVCGGIIDKILNDRDSKGAVEFTRNTLQEIITGKFHMDKYIITKTLRNGYKDWTRIVHAVLAHRMTERNPGDAPQSNDRIPYVYIETDKKVELQGDRVEHPKYVIENKLKLDYLFYITNQIMKPCLQFLELIVENPEDIFKEYIIKEQNRQKGTMPINSYINIKPDEIKELEIDNCFDENLLMFDNEITKIQNKKNQKKVEKIIIKKLKKKIIMIVSMMIIIFILIYKFYLYILFSRMEFIEIKNNNINNSSIIGKGAYGTVYKINDTNKIIKIMDTYYYIDTDDQKNLKLYQPFIITEMSNYNHLNRINNIGKFTNIYKSNTHINLEMDYLGLSLDKFINNYNISINLIKIIMLKLSNTLLDSYNKFIIHCDLKPPNILIQDFNNSLNVNLIDFGLSRFVIDSDFNQVYDEIQTKHIEPQNNC